MIRRNTTNGQNYIERFDESSFVASSGINTTTPPTSSNTVVDINNFDIAEDGGLTLRKPLINKYSWNTDEVVFLNYIFDSNYCIKILEMFSINSKIHKYEIRIYNSKTYAEEDVLIRYTPYGTESSIESTNYFSGDLSNIKIINTTSTSIITGARVYASTYKLTDTSLNTDEFVYRYLRLFKENDTWVLEIVNPEINEFTSAESAVLNPNLTLDYHYAIKDNYNAASVGVKNILAYAFSNNETVHPTVNTTQDFSTLTVKELTEKVTGVAPRILSTLRKDSNFPVCLKAFVDVKPTEDTSNYICIWEKTFNGVDWTEVPEFVDNTCVLIELPDSKSSNEDIASSGIYKTLKKCKVFNPKNNQDLVSKRPDCLVLNSFDTATYRFTIYSLKGDSSPIFYYFENSLSIDNNTLSVDTKDTYIYNKVLTSEESSTPNSFKISINFKNNMFSNSDGSFKIRIVCKDNVTHTFKNEDLRYSYTSSGGGYASHALYGYFNVPALDNFYDTIPMLLKVYYKNKLLTTFKIIINRYQTIDYNTTVPNQEWIGFYKFSKIDDVDSTPAANTIPYIANPMESRIKKVDFKNNTPYTVSSYRFEYHFGDWTSDQTLKNRNYYSVIEVPGFETNTVSYYRTSEEDVEQVYYLNNLYTFLIINNKNAIVFTTPEMDNISSIEDYKTIYNTQKHIGLNPIYEAVDITDTEVDEKYLLTTLNLGFQQYSFTFAETTEFIYSDIPNTVQGEKLYYKKAIYTYGKEFKNNIYPTYTDSFITPLFNVIDLDATGSSFVTSVTPWRDYLIASTETTMYLITRTSEGFYTKIVNSFIGIPYKDRKTCKAILNGIIFKAGKKIYTLYPNAYSGDDTMLNISEISTPIESLLPDGEYDNFAISTEKAYYLFIPHESTTTCFKYNFVKKIWTRFTYPERFTDYKIISLDDIRLFTENKEYYFEKDLTDIYDNVEDNIRYGDYLDYRTIKTDSIEEAEDPYSFVTPFEYHINSGQKANNMSFTKQFKESKFLLATLNERYVFPFSIDISVDGALYNIHKDANTDSSLWKTSTNSMGAIGMSLAPNNADSFNIIRQMYLRYSGKGKSIQHCISGSSYFNFKFYMVYYRYRTLNIKQ